MSATLARLKLQLSISPRAVLVALAWRMIRRPALTAFAPSMTRRLGWRSRRAPDWVSALLRTATPPPHTVLQTLLDSDATLFGYALRGPIVTLRASDARFDLELMRCQSVHPLLAALWTGAATDSLRPAIAGRIVSDMRAALAMPGGYPMDVGLRAVTALLVLATIDAQRLDAPPGFRDELTTGIQAAIVRCFCDPEYSGRLSNNHHLTTAGLLAVLSEVVDDGVLVRAIRRRAWHWLLQANAVQFHADGAHFENSTGYHMACSEVIALAQWVACTRQAAEPSEVVETLAQRLRGCLDFAEGVSRPDGTWPLIGDFDGSRILRLHVNYCIDIEREMSIEARDAVVVAQYSLRFVEKVSADGALRFIRLAARRASLLGDKLTLSSERKSDDTIAGAPVYGAHSGEDSKSARKIDGRNTDISIAPEIVSGRWQSIEADANDRAMLAEAAGRHFESSQIAGYSLALPSGTGRFDSMRVFADAGVLVARSDTLHITLRDGSPGQFGMGTHSHLDHLSLDIWHDGQSLFADPGSWVYAARPERRRRYRDASAHASPLASLIEDSVLQYPFMLDAPPPRARLQMHETMFYGVCKVGRHVVVRLVRTTCTHLFVIDASTAVLCRNIFHTSLIPASSYFGSLSIRHKN